MKEASVNMWIGWYLVVGVVWAVLVFKHHRAIQHMRRAAGDSYTMLALFPVVLLWPAELVGLLVYCVLFTVVFLRDCIRHVFTFYRRRAFQADMQDLAMPVYQHGISDQTVECHQCGVKHTWQDPANAPFGWVLNVPAQTCTPMNTDANTFDSHWLCPTCAKRTVSEMLRRSTDKKQ